jgi:transketolase
MALAEANLNATYGDIVDHFTFGICSDGDLMEGVTSEACSLAGHLGLGKLIFLFDDNSITIDGRTDISFTEDVLARYEAYGWHVARVEDGNDIEAIDAAIEAAKAETNRPSLISVKTVIGYGSPNKADSSSSHGSPLGDDEVAATKAAYGWDPPPFFVPDEVRQHMDARVRGTELSTAWDHRFDEWTQDNPEAGATLARRIEGKLPDNWADGLPQFSTDAKGMATRASGSKVISALMGQLPELVGGSADLAGSNKTLHPEYGVIAPGAFAGQNIHFGVREHAMGAIANGLTLHGGFRGFGATFLVFADYMRPALRIAALSHVPSLTVFTHDSIGLGEDGPTHQPIEHLASLRAMPNYAVFRPGDANEVRECWEVAIERTDGPSALVLTRQNVPTLDRDALGARGDATRGGYILADCDGTPDVILIGTGSEVSLCVDAWQALTDEGVNARVVSLPCWSQFEAQPADWRNEVLPPEVTARVAVEAAATFGWERWVGASGRVVGMTGFGASAPAEVAFEKFGFTAENVAAQARELLQ